jgi:hypothetical protein
VGKLLCMSDHVLGIPITARLLCGAPMKRVQSKSSQSDLRYMTHLTGH